jgi:hypothetical protein
MSRSHSGLGFLLALLARDAQHMGAPIGMFRNPAVVVATTFILEGSAGEFKEN